MKLTVRTPNIEAAQRVQDFVRRCTSQSLERIRHRLGRIDVSIRDVNGPKGGVDIMCRLHVRLRDGREVVVKQRGADPFVAFKAALNAAKRRVTERSRRTTAWA